MRTKTNNYAYWKNAIMHIKIVQLCTLETYNYALSKYAIMHIESTQSSILKRTIRHRFSADF